jgi:BetI-type transcriptional repressor, C-terminal
VWARTTPSTASSSRPAPHTAVTVRQSRRNDGWAAKRASQVAGSCPAPASTALAGLLPLDDDARADALVGSAFLVRAVGDPVARERLRTGEQEILAALADGLARARDAGAVAAGVDPDTGAEVLHALAGGLADSLLVERHTPDSALAVLDRHLASLRPRP